MKSIVLIFLLLSGRTASAKKFLTFDEALEAIVNRDTSLPSEKVIKEAKEVDVLSKKLSFLPSLSTGYSRTKTKETNFSTESKINRKFIRADLNLFNGLGDFYNMQGAEFGLTAQEHQVSQAELDVEEKAVRGLIDFILKKEEVRIARVLVNANQRSLKTSQARYKKGLTAKQEVDKVRVDIENAKARLSNSIINLERSRAVLISLLGHAKVKKGWPWKNDLQEMGPNHALYGKLKLTQRPDFNLATSLMRERENLLRVAKSSYFPTIDLSYTLSNSQISGIDQDERVTVLSVTFPLFEGLSDYANVKSNVATLNKSRQNLKQVERDALSNFEVFKLNLKTRLRTANSREATLILSRRLYRDNFRRFRKGRVSVNDLLVDQNRLIDSESLANSGWAQAHLSLMELCHAHGMKLKTCF